MTKGIKGIYFDFGFVIYYPKPDLEKRYRYLDWDGINLILEDKEMSQYLLPGVGEKELEAFFKEEIYDVWLHHEDTDLTDPKSNNLLLEKLHIVFNCQINQQLVDKILTHINRMKYFELHENMSQILEYLRKRKLCISMVSNMLLPGKLLIEKLREDNILHYFNTVTTSSDIGFTKPHKEIFLQTMEKDNLKALEVLFVGDTYRRDIIGAKSVGMNTVWLNCRNETVPNKEAADYEIYDLKDLVKLEIICD